VLGNNSRDEVLLRRLGVHYLAMTSINEQLPAAAVVTFLWEPRSYYCERDCRPDSILDKFSHLEYLYGDAIDIANAWREEGVTHVLLYQTGLDFVMAMGAEWIAPHNISILRDLQAQELQPVANWGGVYILYELQP
jgi:hypothetical protein